MFVGDELRWSFTSDSSVNGWGWRFTVYPVMSNQNPRELGSDRAVLSQPSMDMIMCLLNPRLYKAADKTLMSRLAAALAACSQLSFLCKYCVYCKNKFNLCSSWNLLQHIFSLLAASQRMWSLQQLHRLLVVDSSQESCLLHLQNLKASESALGNLVQELPQALVRQYEYEDISVRSGLHLMHSDFFKVGYH